mgnify:CR=1 FL=1
MKLTKAFKTIWKNKKGFTIVELMAVFAILAVIAAIAVPSFSGTIDKAKEKADEATINVLNRAIEQYLIDNPDASLSGKDYDDLEEVLEGDYIKEFPNKPEQSGKSFVFDATKNTVSVGTDSDG